MMRVALATLGIAALGLTACQSTGSRKMPDLSEVAVSERQVTSSAEGHQITNIGAWSHDGKWLIYDLRRVDSTFDSPRIERVNVETGAVKVLFSGANGACVGVATCSPLADRTVFIKGPENPSADWSYGATHRQGVVVDFEDPGRARNLDARDIVAPYTAGALRGGTHVHTFSGDGQWVSFTYEDHVLAAAGESPTHEPNQRNVGVSVPIGSVAVPATNDRNHDGDSFTVLVTRTVAKPRPGSDEISKAFEDAWVGRDGYLRADGSRQKRAIAFQGNVVTAEGKTISEVFLVDLPEDPAAMAIPGDGPLEGTATMMPRPPKQVVQRRLTHTEGRAFPGIQGPRHWLRSSPDGSRIAFLAKDDAGVVQFWTVSPNGGAPEQITRNEWDVQSAFSWSPDGEWLAYAMDNSVWVTEAATGKSRRLTPRSADASAPMTYSCIFSPDGRRIAFMRPADPPSAGPQLHVVEWN